MHRCVHHCHLGIDGTVLRGPEIPEEDLCPARALCSEKGAERPRGRNDVAKVNTELHPDPGFFLFGWFF